MNVFDEATLFLLNYKWRKIYYLNADLCTLLMNGYIIILFIYSNHEIEIW